MMWIPFLSLFTGFVIGLRKLSARILLLVDQIMNVVLIMLMLTIGMNIGINDKIISKLSSIGFHCLILSLSAIFCSVLMVVLLEKTLLPLDILRQQLMTQHMNLGHEVDISKAEAEKDKGSPLIWIMPLSIITGVLIGRFILPTSWTFMLDYSLTYSLILLYISVGISLASNRDVFKYVKLIGFRVVYLSIAIFIGSLFSGFLLGVLLKIPLTTSVLSSCGMSYYSITGAYMTKSYGIEAGTYGFVVNVMREFFTVIFLPILVKISSGSPIAAGAAGNMDTMLVPVTKFVGAELGLITLITGVILTFAVPFLLPILSSLF